MHPVLHALENQKVRELALLSLQIISADASIPPACSLSLTTQPSAFARLLGPSVGRIAGVAKSRAKLGVDLQYRC